MHICKTLRAALAATTILVPFAAATAQSGRIHPPASSESEAAAAQIAAAANRAQREPGITNEIAPGTMQTATGGPSGGIPGHSGGP